MIVIRNVFQLKFGKARDAIALMKEGTAIEKRVMAGLDYSSRVLTDVTGRFYTLVLEITVPDLATFEKNSPRLFGDKEQCYRDGYKSKAKNKNVVSSLLGGLIGSAVWSGIYAVEIND